MKRVLFIDRDGTLIQEPPVDFQVDSLNKLEFMPGVFRNLHQLQEKLGYELVMVTNQDGLGTDSFPEEDFWPAQNKMLQALENEGIIFSDILIDKSFPEDNAPTRKPRTGLLKKYLSEDYDLANSYVIGDRLTDLELAKNLGAKGVLINKSFDSQDIVKAGLTDSLVKDASDWSEVLDFLIGGERIASVVRNTQETQIKISLDLDGKGASHISTGLKFFDHMLDQIAKHGGIQLNIDVSGDLDVDEHHTIEDTGLALGEAFKKALGDKRGIERYGYALPMDDCMAQALIDFGGRPWLVWEAEFKREMVGDMPTEMFHHFFKSFSDTAQCNLNIKAEGQNEHHKIEGIFKALARALKMAKKRDVFNYELPSTKGVL